MREILSMFESTILDAALLEQIKSTTVGIAQYAKFAGFFLFGLLLLSTLFRFLFGKKAQINISITAAIEIFFVYVLYIMVWIFPVKFPLVISQLPLITLVEDLVVFFPVLQADFPALCEQLLHLLMIAFLVNLLSSLSPRPKHVLLWLLQHLLLVAASMAVVFGLELLLSSFLPLGFGDYAPMILLIVLCVLIVLGTMRLLVGTAIAFVSPLFGALYAFFFSNFLGRALSRAIVTTLLLTGIVTLLNALGIYAVPVAVSALTGHIPLLAIAFGLWILIGHVFTKE